MVPNDNVGLLTTDDPHTLVLATREHEAALAETLLRDTGPRTAICRSLADVHAALAHTTCCVIFTEDAVRDADLSDVGGWVASQPAWSDLPMILLVDQGGGPEREPLVRRLSKLLGNVSLVERPFHPTTFLSVVRAALKARRRQHEARAHQHALRDHQQRLDVALLAGQLGTWDYDPSSRQFTASDACKALFGRPPDQPFTIDDLHASLHEPDRPGVAEMLAAQDIGHDHARECRAIWPDGSRHWLDLRARVLAPTAGDGVRFAGVASDISGRKHAEAALRRVNETLDQQMHQRTVELQAAHHAVLEQMAERQQAEDQLRQVQKVETIGQLTGGVAHDFNNLLMVVLGNLQLLRKRLPEDPRLTRLLDGAVQGARRGAVLTQRLLAFARRQDLQPSPVDLVALVAGMHDLLRQSVGAGIEIALDIPASLPMAMADANQIESALLNLVINARDAMPSGGTVFVRLRHGEHPRSEDLRAGSYVGLIVCDTGVGMDGQTLERAVEPFFSTKELGKGSGLGLSMVHGLAVQLQGALRLFSKPDAGTCAELWLPVAIGPAVAAATPWQEQASPVGARILVVDDDSLVSASTTVMLEDLGHTVIEAGSGSEAMAVLRGDAVVDLVITDYAMPRMSGLDLARAARAVRPGLLVLLATGYADLPEGQGTDLPRLSKPYSQEQLAAQLTTLLAGAHQPLPEY